MMRLVKTLKYAVAFVAVYLLAVCTRIGQSAENALIVGYADQARIFEILYSVGPPPLKGQWATLLAGLAVIALIAVIRRRWVDGCFALGVAAATMGVTEVLSKFVLPRPDLSDAPRNLIDASFPSGHVAIAAGLTLGAALVSSPRIRGYVVAAGTLWIAVTAAGVQALYWHRPSDVLGATLLACTFYSLATQLRPAAGPKITRPPTLPILALAAAGALLASSREDSYTRPLAFAAAAFLCATLIWTAAAPSTEERGPRDG